MIRGVEVGHDKVLVSHLQYADDTLFVLDGTEDNARAIKWLLLNFEFISGLSVNFDKSRVFSFNMGVEVVERVAEVLGCKTGSAPIPYLGMLVGGRAGGVQNWAGVVERTKKRVMRWDTKAISLGGRATVVSSVLSSIPIYFLSFHKLPKSVEKVFRFIYSRFLWGGNDDEKKITWIKWDDLCREKKA